MRGASAPRASWILHGEGSGQARSRSAPNGTAAVDPRPVVSDIWLPGMSQSHLSSAAGSLAGPRAPPRVASCQRWQGKSCSPITTFVTALAARPTLRLPGPPRKRPSGSLRPGLPARAPGVRRRPLQGQRADQSPGHAVPISLRLATTPLPFEAYATRQPRPLLRSARIVRRNTLLRLSRNASQVLRCRHSQSPENRLARSTNVP